MKEILVDTIFDTVKLLPFLFVAFLIIEYIEHKVSQKSKTKIENAGKYGPIIGSLFGAIPQCGFSVLASNLYATRIITLGTLISIYLSTSDEMVLILFSQHVDIKLIFLIVLTKVIIGIVFGMLIDLFLNYSNKIVKKNIKHFCEEEHCNCRKGVVISSLRHTINITLFIFIFTFILNGLIYYIGEDTLKDLFLKESIFAPFISSLIGLIPNCASSVILTELYLSNIISFASLLAGLLTGSGIALLVLFKANKNLKENIFILSLLYLIGAFVGVFIELFFLI